MAPRTAVTRQASAVADDPRIGADETPTEFLGKLCLQFSWMCISTKTTRVALLPRKQIMPAIQASLSDLRRADGSATFSCNGYSVLGAVNGPLEVQRRDELPEEAAIEVNVRPASGVGSKSAIDEDCFMFFTI